MPDVIERLLEVYVRERIEDERFIDTVRRLGVAPFKEHVYATPIKARTTQEKMHMRDIIKDRAIVADDWAVLRLAEGETAEARRHSRRHASSCRWPSGRRSRDACRRAATSASGWPATSARKR